MNYDSVYSGQMTIPKDYFIEEYHRFREIMCSTRYTIEQKDEAFSGLSFVYLNIREDEFDESVSNLFQSLQQEFSKRKTLEHFNSILTKTG